MYINIFFYPIVQFIMDNFIIHAGIFKNDTKVGIKNVNIYKSPQWTTCFIKQNNTVYKCINVDDLLPDAPYPIELEKYQGLSSLLYNNMIIYQQKWWFEYQLEFLLSEAWTGVGEKFAEYTVRYL